MQIIITWQIKSGADLVNFRQVIGADASLFEVEVEARDSLGVSQWIRAKGHQSPTVNPVLAAFRLLAIDAAGVITSEHIRRTPGRTYIDLGTI